jgi:PAS domain S-box-containing protein
MRKSIPMATFEDSPEPTMVVDADGAVAVCNQAAADLLGLDRKKILGKRCWSVGGLHHPTGECFCTRDCAIQQDARLGILPSRRRLVLEAGGRSRPVDVLTFLMPDPESDGERVPLLHVLEPVAQEKRQVQHPHPVNLDVLSPRELEVLRLLAAGRSTAEIAQELHISRVTVRNHVQRVLKKLGVHSRMEAVLACVRLK